jgi:hypothetical protein
METYRNLSSVARMSQGRGHGDRQLSVRIPDFAALMAELHICIDTDIDTNTNPPPSPPSLFRSSRRLRSIGPHNTLAPTQFPTNEHQISKKPHISILPSTSLPRSLHPSFPPSNSSPLPFPSYHIHPLLVIPPIIYSALLPIHPPSTIHHPPPTSNCSIYQLSPSSPANPPFGTQMFHIISLIKSPKNCIHRK